MPKRVSAVLLAAGASTRYGSAKQLATLDGVALVNRALSTLRRSRVDEVVVVLGSRAREIEPELRGGGFRVVVNEKFREGLSSSLRAGVASLEGSDAAVIVLADQPFLTARLIDSLVERYVETGSPVVTTVSGGLVTPPVLLDRSLFGEVSSLRGDVGAKPIVVRHPEAERVEAEPDAVLDVDTLQDMGRARELLSRRKRARARGAGARGRAPPS